VVRFRPVCRSADLPVRSGRLPPKTGRLISDDITGQTEQTFRNIEVLLRAAGASLDDVLSCLVHTTDLAELQAFNAAYETPACSSR